MVIKNSLASYLVLISFLLGAIYGYMDMNKLHQIRLEQCHKQTSIIPMSEICEYYGFDQSCQVKQRLMYTYASHRFYACLFGKKGKAWGTIPQSQSK